MKIKILLGVSIVIVLFSVMNIIGLLNQNVTLNKETDYDKVLSVWTTSKGLTLTLKEIALNTDYEVVVKQFNDQETLQEELSFISEYPDLIEIDSLSNASKIYNSYELMQPIFLQGVSKGIFHPAVLESFTHDDSLYAYPLGMELPLLIHHQTMTLDEDEIYPFVKEKQLKSYAKQQAEIVERNKESPFWMFHFDENINWYSDIYDLNHNPTLPGNSEVMFEMLKEDYELVPRMDHQMAITRFVNGEIAALITGSNNLHSIQELIGNRFEYNVSSLVQNEDDAILIKANGLIILNETEEVTDLLNRFNDADIQEKLLSHTGWLPVYKEYLKDVDLIRTLPMSKFIQTLIKQQDNFVGKSHMN